MAVTEYATLADFFAFGLLPLACRTAPAAASAVTRTGTGAGLVTSGGQYDVTITAATSSSLRIRIAAGGALGTCTAEVSTNGGTSYATAVTVPASGQLAMGNTGVVATLSGTFVAGDVYAWTVTSSVGRCLSLANTKAHEAVLQRFSAPITAWEDDLRAAVCHIAALDVLSVKGFDPTREADKAIADRAALAEAFLKGVRERTRSLVGVTDTTPQTDEGGPILYTNSQRGWTA